jgi:hypothetical protein
MSAGSHRVATRRSWRAAGFSFGAPANAADIPDANQTDAYLTSLRGISHRLAVERGEVEVTAEWTTVLLHDSYAEPLIVPYLLDSGDTALIGVRNISNDGLEIRSGSCDPKRARTQGGVRWLQAHRKRPLHGRTCEANVGQR